MKILMIENGYPIAGKNINGIFGFDQARALSARGHEVVFAALDTRSLRRWRRWGSFSLVDKGVRVEGINVPVGRVPAVFLDAIKEFFLRRLYERVVRKYGKPDVVHSHFIGMGYPTVRVLSGLGVPLVHTEHYSGLNQPVLSPYLKRVGEYTYSRVDRLCAVSDVLSLKIEKNFEKKPVTVPNMIDFSMFNPLFEDRNDGLFQMISVGNLIPLKRMDLLIEAFSRVFEEMKDVRLLIVGDGPEKKRLEKLVDDLKMTGRIELAGKYGREQIGKRMQECQAFVLASSTETFGVAYVEALAMGLPVIATRCGGPEGYVDESNGILVDVDDPLGLEEALLCMYRNYESYDGREISSRIRERFSEKRITDLLLEIYDDVIERRQV